MKKKLYLTRERLSDNKIWNIVVLFENRNQASVIKMRRTKTDLIKNEHVLEKKGNKLFESENMSLKVNRNGTSIEMTNDNFFVHKVKRGSSETEIKEIHKMIEENDIIWANEHQITYHDLRQDSISYLYRNSEKIPYKTEKWYLITIGKEYFLTINNASNSIPRIQIKGGDMYQTQCSVNGCKEYKISLRKKQNTQD